jgi:ATP-dependent exoDNAse (exonuclease V) alpha subunit
VAAAAYRSGEALYDQAQEKLFVFDKPDIYHTEILAPEGAPEWVFDREQLWNTVERCEKRGDAQLAREVEITLPRELSREESIELVRDFVRETFVADGMVADIGIHSPAASDGGEQPHAHVMLTMRRLDSRTETGFSKLKERDWNEPVDVAQAVAAARKRFNDSGLEQDRDALKAAEAERNVNRWRAAWSGAANRALAQAGSQARIDHRTLAAQGITRPPLPSIGLPHHMQRAYAHLNERLTQWIVVKKKAMLWHEAQAYNARDPAKLAAFVLRLHDMTESMTTQYRHKPIPEVPLDR